MKYRIFLDFRTPTPFKEKSSDEFKDFHFDVNLTSLPRGVMN